MRKGCTTILVVSMALVFSACNSDKDNEKKVSDSPAESAENMESVDQASQPDAGDQVDPSDTSGGLDDGPDGSEGNVPDLSGGGSTETGTGGISETNTGGSNKDAAVSETDAIIGEGTDFEQCIASLEENCDVHEKETAEKIDGAACAAITMIPIPLLDGTQYGPVTTPAGPYGGRIEWNAGAGTDFVNTVSPMEVFCIPVGIQTFMEPTSVNEELFNTRDIDYSLYTIIKPACMKDGEKYPVITWANGTCGITHGYIPLLGAVASHGFVVIANNSTWTGATTSPEGIPVQLRALDYAEYLNENPDSDLYQRLDLDKIGAMGHSQGSGATSSSASDPRIKAIIMWNAGISNDKPFLNVSGDKDMFGLTPASMDAETNGSRQPGAWVYLHQVLETGGHSTGHLTLMEQPDRVIDMAVAWWKYILQDDPEAKKMFLGDDCGLCNRADELEYGHNSLLQ